MTDTSIPLSELPVTRAQAKAEKSPFYFPGTPCPKGHIAKRRTGSGYCNACESSPEILALRAAKLRQNRVDDPELVRAKFRAYRDENKERVREWRENWRERHREILRIKAIAYYRENIDERRAANRAATRANPEANRKRVKEWVKANPDAARALGAHYRARKRGAEGRHTAADIAQIREWQAGNCAACQRDLSKTGHHVDHIIPLARGGSNWQSNLQLLCPRCNSSKHANDYAEWIEEQRRLGNVP